MIPNGFSVEPLPEPSPEPGQLQGLEALESGPEQNRLPSVDFPLSPCSISRNSLRFHNVSVDYMAQLTSRGTHPFFSRIWTLLYASK